MPCKASVSKYEVCIRQCVRAHDRRDGASAASYAAGGHCYKTGAQGYVTEHCSLVERALYGYIEREEEEEIRRQTERFAVPVQ